MLVKDRNTNGSLLLGWIILKKFARFRSVSIQILLQNNVLGERINYDDRMFRHMLLLCRSKQQLLMFREWHTNCTVKGPFIINKANGKLRAIQFHKVSILERKKDKWYCFSSFRWDSLNWFCDSEWRLSLRLQGRQIPATSYISEVPFPN